MRILAHACALICTLSLGLSLSAQEAVQGLVVKVPLGSDSSGPKPTAAEQAILAATSLRADIASEIGGRTLKVPDAMERLRAPEFPAGFKLLHEAGFAFAAIDVGQRLVVMQRLEEAGQCFQEAENSLAGLVKETPDSSAQEKAQYLAQLALIRLRFLNKIVEGTADLDTAQKLRPTDKNLQHLRDSLINDKAEFIKTSLKKG